MISRRVAGTNKTNARGDKKTSTKHPPRMISIIPAYFESIPRLSCSRRSVTPNNKLVTPAMIDLLIVRIAFNGDKLIWNKYLLSEQLDKIIEVTNSRVEKFP
ncbi:hypothetical protein [Patiriisocius sp. Uisw_017]|jgi:hypothetical protein|uniref:hypothetical protein n=1 Tax=Patiriisocius sp. Uisw_017 TaxID=3230968 RepID=UPI0039E8BFB3